MKKLIILSLLTLPAFAMTGCSSTYKERKAPCPPSASLSHDPCNHIPLNMAMIEKETMKS